MFLSKKNTQLNNNKNNKRKKVKKKKDCFSFIFCTLNFFPTPHNNNVRKNMKQSYISYFRCDKFIPILTYKHVTLQNNFPTN